MHGACIQTDHPTTPRSTHAPRSPQPQPNSRWICSADRHPGADQPGADRATIIARPFADPPTGGDQRTAHAVGGRTPRPVEPAYRRAACPRARPATAVHRCRRGLCALPRVGSGIAGRRPGHGVCRSSSRRSCGPSAVRRRGRKRCSASAGSSWRRSTCRYRSCRSCRVGGCWVGGRHGVARPRWQRPHHRR